MEIKETIYKFSLRVQHLEEMLKIGKPHDSVRGNRYIDENLLYLFAIPSLFIQ